MPAGWPGGTSTREEKKGYCLSGGAGAAVQQLQQGWYNQAGVDS